MKSYISTTDDYQYIKIVTNEEFFIHFLEMDKKKGGDYPPQKKVNQLNNPNLLILVKLY